MASVSRGWCRACAVCLLLLAAASTRQLHPLNAAASTCSTPDPFAAIGGGVCVNGGWLPKGMVPEAEVPPLPPVPPPTVPTVQPLQSSGCTTPDPFVALGGGVCQSGGWLPPGIVLPQVEVGPTPSVPPPAATPSVDAACVTPDPFASLGGGTCHMGGWLPPGAEAPAPAVINSSQPPSPAPPAIDVRITGTVRHEDGAWFVVSASGVRYIFAEGLPPAAQVAGLVVTFTGSSSPAPAPADRLVLSLNGFAVLPIALPTPDAIAPLLNDRIVTVSTDRDVAARRSVLRDFIWGAGGFPQSARPTILRDDSSPVSGLENLDTVNTLVMEMEGGRSGYGHHFSPRRSNNRAVILHHGHACTFDDAAGPADTGYGMRRTLNALLVQGYAVVTIYMPNHARFSTTRVEVDDCFSLTHYGMFTTPAAGAGSPLKFFLTPTAMALNYLGDGLGFTDISMIGLSGGGWTTTVYAAVDPRITTSVQVAGTLPLYLQRPDLTGDTEQILDTFYRLAGYPDLYVLGAAGPGRRQLQILNRNDDCCFSQFQSSAATGAAFDGEVRAYEREVRTALAAIGSGSFRVEIDDASPTHMISWNSVLNQILPELNGGHQQVSAPSPGTAFVRGVNGHLWHFDSGTWRDTGLPMVGTPAALAGAVNVHDVFYRGPLNRLMHGYLSGSGWQAQDLGVVVLSDPAAASWGSGRFDVVSIDTAYRPVHVSFDGAALTTILAGTSDVSLGIGRPALVTAGPGHLHLFVQGRFDRTLHSLRFGTDQTWTAQVLPSTMLDFPGAVVDASGAVRVYIRGASGALWEAATEAGEWRWTSVTSAAGGRLIRGSPSASVVDGRITVHARTETAGLAVFRLAGGWTVEDAGGVIVGSPTSSSGAAHAVGGSDGVWLFTTAWTWMGRAIR